jgi:hypothetical protein
MTTYKPHGRYDYALDITAVIFGIRDESVVLFHDFECEVDVECVVKRGELSTSVTDVRVDGHSLRAGDDLAQRIFRYVSEKAEVELENGGGLFDQVREAEGLTLTGHPNDPDTSWRVAAE